MRYQANPVIVDAFKIVGVAPKNNMDGRLSIALQNGENYIASAAMLFAHDPEVGDYLVRQSNGYEYLNPKAVFERQYSPLPDPMLGLSKNEAITPKEEKA